jgi:hypothetical protein
MTGQKKVNALAGSPRKLLSLYATLSKTKNIVFDLVGVDPLGANDIYIIINETVNNGEAAMLLDNFDVLRNNCTNI